jgi:hypothetical protein
MSHLHKPRKIKLWVVRNKFMSCTVIWAQCIDMLLQFLLLQHKPIKLFIRLLGAKDHGDFSVFVFLYISQFLSFLCPHKFDSLCWGLIQVSTTIRATTICFTSTTSLCHCGVQTCLGRMLSLNISFISSIWKLFWSQTSGIMPWECGQA